MSNAQGPLGFLPIADANNVYLIKSSNEFEHSSHFGIVHTVHLVWCHSHHWLERGLFLWWCEEITVWSKVHWWAQIQGMMLLLCRISLREGSNLLPASYCADFVAKFNYSSNFSNVFHTGPQGADYWSLREATPNASCLDCSAWNYTSCLDKKNAGLVTDSRAVTEQSDEMMFLSNGKKDNTEKRLKIRVIVGP